jgi:hypothetical protein
LLCTLKIRAWRRRATVVEFSDRSANRYIARSPFVSAVGAWLACTFAAVTAIAVTRAALTAFGGVFG